MTVIQNHTPFQVALVVRPPLTGVVTLALTHIHAVPVEMQISEVGKAGCDFAVLDEAAADGGLKDAIAEMIKSNKPVLVLVRNHGMQGALNAIGLGATEILRVPFDPAELVIRASQAIHRTTGHLPELDNNVKIGKLHVDRLPHGRNGRHEDDQEHEQHVDHRSDVDLVRQPAAPTSAHCHQFPPGATGAGSLAWVSPATLEIVPGF